jgi:hypothetical protein
LAVKRKEGEIMKKHQVKAAFLVAVFLFTLIISSASAQLIMHDARYRVVQIDTVNNRVELTTLDGNPCRTIRYAFVEPNTLVVTEHGRGIPYTSLQPGWVIRVSGGVRMDANITADKINVLERRPAPFCPEHM